MRSLMVLALAVVGMSSMAQAETFVCGGFGRFAQIGSQTVELEWKEGYQKVLLENANLKVQVNIDKANPDGTHHLSIEVLDSNKTGVRSTHLAKGSLKDIVQYLDNLDGVVSQVVCVPLDK